MRRAARPVVRRAGRGLQGEGTHPPSTLLYVAPEAGASVIATYRTKFSRTYCISCSKSHRLGYPEGGYPGSVGWAATLTPSRTADGLRPRFPRALSPGCEPRSGALRGQAPQDARGMRLVPELVKELENFKVKVNIQTAHDSYEAWRESDHDDLVLALALACWWAEQRRGLRVTARPRGL